MKALLRIYTSVDVKHVTYLQGSPLRMEDRDRAAVSTASAAFVLANKQSDDPVEEDENTILTGLALKQHLGEAEGPAGGALSSLARRCGLRLACGGTLEARRKRIARAPPAQQTSRTPLSSRILRVRSCCPLPPPALCVAVASSGPTHARTHRSDTPPPRPLPPDQPYPVQTAAPTERSSAA